MTESVDAEGVEGEPAAEDGSVDELVARIAAEDEGLAAEVAGRLDRVGELESQVDELTSRLKRTQADFQNYKKRAKRRQAEIEDRATEDLVTRLLDVRDDLSRALDQEAGTDIRDGVEVTLNELDRVLGGEDVERIEPTPGSEVDPERHEVVHRAPGEQPTDAIETVYRPGYVMAGKVLRPAQVTVSEGPDG